MLLIGDVHGKYDEYLKIIDQYPSSIQLGDMGFSYDHLNRPKYRSHKFFKGNHDDYSKHSQNDLGNFGLSCQAGHYFFFIRGAYSIDKTDRFEGISWWREEELNYTQAQECLDIYEYLYSSGNNNNGEIILSHDCPQFLANGLWGYSPSFTRKLLDGIWQIRKPKLWVFGHHHKHIDITIEGCRFVCLNELETMII